MSIRPGKYIEYDFPLFEVNRLAVKESPVGGRKPIYQMHKWWARRLSCVFRTILLASAIDWGDWDGLEPWQRDKDGDFADAEGRKITDEGEYHRRKRREGVNNAWERLYYRLDDEANAVIRWAFTKPKAPDARRERLAEYLGMMTETGETPVLPEQWWEKIDWEAREPITILDPFMGGGTTIVEALRLGANVVGVDLNPVAWFVTKKETDGCDLEELEEAFKQVEAEVAEQIKSYYKTTCPCCGKQADVMYVFWVKLAPCPERTCGATVPLYNSFVIAKKKAGKRKRQDVPRNKAGQPGMLLEEGKDGGIQFIKCPHKDCGEIYASKRPPADHQSECPTCGTVFDPDKGYAGKGKYTCPDCGLESKILAAAKANIPEGMDRNVPLPHRMYGIELYCPHCEYKGYKKPDDLDRGLFEKAKADFRANRDVLKYPTQQIPPGVKTDEARNHGFYHWHELFNERQLLCLCRLRETILTIKNPNIKEYLTLAWSSALETSNCFARYNCGARQVESIFGSHAFIPKATYAENNVWGAEFGRGTFRNCVPRIANALRWVEAPYDNFFVNDEDYRKVMIGDGIFGDGTRTGLFAQSSETLSNCWCERSVAIAQFIITDPPYYGNVMYAELSDFFYVWLRSVLAAHYPDAFTRSLTPKDEEIVEQVSARGNVAYLTKDRAFFAEGLTRVFSEAGRYLSAKGLLVFTFHHQANEAWASVLNTALDAGYYMMAVVPVHAENIGSLHIKDKANISYDAVIVCRKQTEAPERAEWQDLTDRIYLKAQRLVRELESQRATNGQAALAPEDIYVIAIGKCLEEYSQYYFQGHSYVYHKGQPVDVEAALNGDDTRDLRGIGEIVDQLVEEAEGRMWPAGLDPLTRFYCVSLLGQSEVPYDRIHRRLRNNTRVTLDDLEKAHLVLQKKGKVKVPSPAEREEYLMALFDEAPLDDLFSNSDEHLGTQMSYIDRLHLLYLLDEKGHLTGALTQQWSQDRTFSELVQRIAQYLDPKNPERPRYARLAGELSGTGTLDLE